MTNLSDPSPDTLPSVLIIGAGPAGLTAAAELAENAAAREITVLEKDPTYVGGISRTVRYKNFRFDIGGHRFFSKNAEVTRWWRDRLPAGAFIQVNRLSRILYRGKFFDYPLKAANAFFNLGPLTCVACVGSYLKSRLFPVKVEKSFADWVSNRFGKKLFSIFFRTYTEKVWGMPCETISADWAAQRIKGLSLSKAILNALLPKRRRAPGAPVVKTLIDQFEYPRLGPGMMWERTAADIQKLGAKLHLGEEVTRIRHDGERVSSVFTRHAASGQERQYRADEFIVSMPLRDCALAFDPPLAAPAVAAAERLQYRDFLTVALVVKRTDLFPDNWIYVHDPGVKLGRIQNFNNWSAEMVPEPGTTCLGLEYFCFEGDGLWSATDAELIELGKRELAQLGLVRPEEVVDGTVVRQEKAYPVYGPGYAGDVAAIRAEVMRFGNFQVAGRNGMHKYNNQDHSMLTALFAARNVAAGGRGLDLWRVNGDAEYHEDGDVEETTPEAGGRRVPAPLPTGAAKVTAISSR